MQNYKNKLRIEFAQVQIISEMDLCDILNLGAPYNVYIGASHFYHTPVKICSVTICVSSYYNSSHAFSIFAEIKDIK